ncbi:MAG: hypothetical protein FJ090_17745, partial [Deltaproteobacteria bacterium]|nr:hypothetical protein [Deltaproteobacteria bacterium]
MSKAATWSSLLLVTTSDDPPLVLTGPSPTGLLPSLAAPEGGPAGAWAGALLVSAGMFSALGGGPPGDGLAVLASLGVSWLAGLGAGWLAARWWGCPGSALACGLAWQAATLAAAPAERVLLAVLPVGVGLFLRAARAPDLPATGAAALVPALLLTSGVTALQPLLVIAVPALAAEARRGGLVTLLSAASGVVGATLVLASPILAMNGGAGPGLVAGSAPLGAVALAAIGAYRARRFPRRWALPMLALI